MNASVKWKGGMSFNGTSESDFSVPLGADTQVGGADDGFRPMELMLIGMAGCTAMDVISILKKKQQDVTGFEVKVRAERTDDHPKVFTKIWIEYVVRGNAIDHQAVERAVELSETKYCSGIAMISKTAQIEHRITLE